MEWDIQETMMIEKEEKEAQATKYSSVKTSSDMDKVKGPMEDVLEESFSQQVKTLIHIAQQFKQKLTKITSMIDTQEVATTQVVDNK